MTELALDVRGLRKHYQGFALKDVSFSLPRGFIMGLIGPNGAGKTTIIRLIMNLTRRDAGEVKVFGLDNRSDEVAVKARIGFVYDTPGFWEDQTLDAQRRALGVFYPRWSDATFASLAAEFELPLDKKYKALSQGTKTKFALAMALSHEADLLVMDEPTTGLDPVFRRDLLKRLSAILQDEGKSILFSTHITSDLERVADFVTFVRAGQVVFSMPTHDLVSRWAVVRGDERAVAALDPAWRLGTRRGSHATEVLVSDGAAARRALGPAVVVEAARLDDVMVLMGGGEGHAA
jgi:ABC-2 type transport system ATP-binding protein